MRKQTIDWNIASIIGTLSLAILILIPQAVQGKTLAAIRNLNSPAFFPILAACLVLLSSITIGVQVIAGLPEANTVIELPLSWRRFGLAALLIGSYTIAILFIGMNVATLMLLTRAALKGEVTSPFEMGCCIPVGALFPRTRSRKVTPQLKEKIPDSDTI